MRAYSEGFEGAYPPAGWTADTTNTGDPTFTWWQDCAPYGTPPEGNCVADIRYDPALVPQDELLTFDHAVTASECYLHFHTMGSTDWSMYACLKVEVNGVQVYDYNTDPNAATWVWIPVQIDLSGYTGTTVTIGFRYIGADGAQQCLDAVVVNDEWISPPEPPENDVCDRALPLPCGNVNISGSTALGMNDYDPTSAGCTTWQAAGADVVYVITVCGPTNFDLTYTCAFDNSFYFITDCGDPLGSCVIGMDDDYTYYIEHMVGTLPGAGTYYLIIDAYSSGEGDFTLTGTIDCATATESSSWGKVKQQFR